MRCIFFCEFEINKQIIDNNSSISSVQSFNKYFQKNFFLKKNYNKIKGVCKMLIETGLAKDWHKSDIKKSSLTDMILSSPLPLEHTLVGQLNTTCTL